MADLKTTMDDYERELIQAALDEAGGHQRRAAISLGLLPTTLCEKIKRLGMRQKPLRGSGATTTRPDSIENDAQHAG